MLIIDKYNNIELTRGDSAYIGVVVEDIRGQARKPQEGDRYIFTVKKNTTDEEYKIQKEIPADMGLYLRPADTVSIPFGRYMYDIQLITANGDIFTVIGPAYFVLGHEITEDN